MKKHHFGISKIPLQMVLIIPFVLQIFGAVGLVGYLSFKNGQKAVKDLVEQLMDRTINKPLAKINYGIIMGYKNLLSISIRHSNEVTKVLCIDDDMDFL